MNFKHCTQCEQHLPYSDFYRDRSRADGLQGRCKTCSKSNSRAYYHANKDKAAAYQREWHSKNRERINAARRQRRAQATT